MKRTLRKPRKERHVLHLAAKKQRPRDPLLWQKLGLGFASLSLCAFLLIGLVFAAQTGYQKLVLDNPTFAIAQIDIETSSGSLPRQDILNAAAVLPGQSLMAVDLNAVRQRVEALPAVASVRVQRRLPATLRIYVEERQPVARLLPTSRAGARLAQAIYYLDANGFVIKPKPGEQLKPLPVITGVPSDSVIEGTRLELPEVDSALRFLGLSEYSVIRAELDLNRISVDHKGYLIVWTRNRGSIRFRTDHLSEQIQRLEVILADAKNRRLVVRSVDLSPERNVPVTYFQ
ncbi:MAG: FtsQ-type POTRA domain-containing protein [Verrucomicrobiia bacterium]